MDDESKLKLQHVHSDQERTATIEEDKLYWESVSERASFAEKLNQLKREHAEELYAAESAAAAAAAAVLVEKENTKRRMYLDRLTKFMIFIGGLIAAAAYTVLREPEIVKVLLENSFAASIGLFGVLVSIISLFLGYSFSSSKEKTFVDIDDKLYTSRIEMVELERDALRRRNDELEFELANNLPSSYFSTAKSPDSSGPENLKLDTGVSTSPADSKGFEQYIKSIIRSLDMNIELADNKASLLLDKGTAYLWRGIMFYVVSIVVWQVSTSYFSVGPYAVWGMISCSMTFLVVEFLAAWFLRQYKSFTDSSFNLVRVKSVFNRYLLSYFAIKEFSDSSMHLVDMRVQMLKVLEDDIKWLEPVAQKTGDLNHMVAMFESVSGLVEKLKISSKTDSAASSQ